MRTILILGLLAAAAASAQDTNSWRFTTDYHHFDAKGNMTRRERVSGLVTRLPDVTMRWSGVTVANATGDSAPFAEPAKREFMEGFSYPLNTGKEMLQPEFFKGFPPTAMNERCLVWDTQMFEAFAALLSGKLKAGEVYHLPDAAEVPLGGLGSFHQKDVQIVWSGTALRNGDECALIDYRALFNRLQMKIQVASLVGRSDYWGQIWVSLKSRRIQYATLYEEVFGELTLPAQEKPQTVAIVRVAVLEPAK